MNDPRATPARVLIIGRSPTVLVEAVDLLRARGYSANATNRYDRVLDDYDVTDLDLLVFGGMVPSDTKQQLRDEVTLRNPGARFVQGLFGIAGVIAAQVQAAASAEDVCLAIAYDKVSRAVQIDLEEAAHVRVEAWWSTSWTPPEPTSTSLVICDEHLPAGRHTIALPAVVPALASAGAVTAGSAVRVFSIGGVPDAVAQMMRGEVRLPEVAQVTTQT